MVITDVKIYAYTLSLQHPIKIKNTAIDKRQGWYIVVSDNEGREGIGEIAPLDGYGPDSHQEAEQNLSFLKHELIDKELILDEDRLPGDFFNFLDDWGLFPSVQFGVEMALINYISCALDKPFNSLLVEDYHEQIPVTGLLQGNRQQVCTQAKQLLESGYKDFKLKIGKNVESDIKTAIEVNKALDGHALLHVDANKGYSFNDAFQFANEVGCTAITYIEEPFDQTDQISEFFNKTLIPVALDETFVHQSTDFLKGIDGIEFIVLKPMMWGSIRNLWAICEQLIALGIKPVISSSFETAVGLHTLAHIASCICGVGNAGLDTLKYYEDDPWTNGLIRSGTIDTSGLQPPFKLFNREFLEEIN